MFESMIGWILVVYLCFFYFGTVWELAYEVTEVVKSCLKTDEQ